MRNNTRTSREKGAHKPLGHYTRHGRRRKPLRWQIDYLSTRAPLVGALVLRGPKSWECRLAAILAKHYLRPIARFGASDCRCGGHLFYCPIGRDLNAG